MEKTTFRKKRDQIEQTRIDFKMVTFSLAGKDYGIDIMKVKEISKASKFTFVPNAAPFVRGVYNLRGDIISVIDFRTFFNLPIPEIENTVAENMIILRLENHTIAVIVDTIDKVVGIASENIQPPHPLFGDINIKYISGVVENDRKLYVILDVESIFGNEDVSDSKAVTAPRSSVRAGQVPAAESTVSTTTRAIREDVDIGFIEETLITFQSFYTSPVNQDWIRSRYSVWKSQRGENVQLSGEADAEAYLATFSSPCTGMFWSDEYAEKVVSFLNREQKGNFHVWNPGCGSGYESYSITCMIKKYLPYVHLRVIAHDNDLIRISTAPGLIADGHTTGPLYSNFLMSVPRGMGFKKEVKDAILFEYHDISHDNTLPNLDMVVMRDTVSYLVPDRQHHVFSVLNEVMKSGGLLVLGIHEVPINPEAWEKVEKGGVVAFQKK